MTQVHTLSSFYFDCKCAEYYALAGLSWPCLIAILTHIQDLDPGIETSQIHELKGGVDLPESGLPNSYLFKRPGVYLVEVESLGFNQVPHCDTNWCVGICFHGVQLLATGGLRTKEIKNHQIASVAHDGVLSAESITPSRFRHKALLWQILTAWINVWQQDISGQLRCLQVQWLLIALEDASQNHFRPQSQNDVFRRQAEITLYDQWALLDE